MKWKNNDSTETSRKNMEKLEGASPFLEISKMSSNNHKEELYIILLI